MKNSLLALAFAGTVSLTAFAAPPQNPAAAAAAEATKKILAIGKPVPKSSFGIPAKPQDGHDPFYPTSDRLFAVKASPKHSPSSASSAIVFNGISGSKDRPFAMINGHTFAEGEEAPVNTSAGRIRVLLVAIKDDRAIVEIAGERRELTFQGR